MHATARMASRQKLNPNSAIRGASVVVMLGVTGLFDPLGLYQKETAPRSGKTRGPMIVANGVSPIAEFGLKKLHFVRDASYSIRVVSGAKIMSVPPNQHQVPSPSPPSLTAKYLNASHVAMAESFSKAASKSRPPALRLGHRVRIIAPRMQPLHPRAALIAARAHLIEARTIDLQPGMTALESGMPVLELGIGLIGARITPRWNANRRRWRAKRHHWTANRRHWTANHPSLKPEQTSQNCE
jgi:hypothetical protein